MRTEYERAKQAPCGGTPYISPVSFVDICGYTKLAELEGTMVIFQTEDRLSGQSLVVVVIERDNLKRMDQGDPITLRTRKMGGSLEVVEHPDNLQLIIAFENDSGPVYEFMQRQDGVGLLRYLMRGFEIRSTDTVPKSIARA